MKPADPSAAHVKIESLPDGAGHRLRLGGRWTNTGLHAVLHDLEEIGRDRAADDLEIDLSDIAAMDVAGAWMIRRLARTVEANGHAAHLSGGEGRFQELIAVLPDKVEKAEEPSETRSLFTRLFEPVGKLAYSFWGDFLSAMHILGSAVRGAQMKLGRASGVSPASVVNQIDHMGVKATPIILLMSFLIGAIIAQQGAFQLRYFGAEVFVVDLVGILQLREIGVLLTAIMIAGRSGSAITAEIGSMKMREEVDALLVMGLNPVGVLIFPRLVALTIALPLLTILANFASLFGAAMVAWGYSGITFAVFLQRMHEAIDLSTIVSGMIKAPFMALIIGVVAAVEGLKVGGSAESLGLHVTASVVKSIFVVILVDGLFAMFYAAIDF
ncbi:ABC transporter permease [Metarhizobium album]|uniref:ABC transporter permease n=1 Tax=Metarhizobium album TaxID=2182425 RepID=UPI001FE11C7E|nr:MlaE family lipid ABC transporter permease subunit [Rhizobium album]